MRAKEFLKEADPYGGGMFSPPGREIGDDEINHAFGYMQEYVQNYFQHGPGKPYLEDLANPMTDPEDRKNLLHDLFGDAMGTVRSQLESDGMDFFSDEDVKREIVKYLPTSHQTS